MAVPGATAISDTLTGSRTGTRSVAPSTTTSMTSWDSAILSGTSVNDCTVSPLPGTAASNSTTPSPTVILPRYVPGASPSFTILTTTWKVWPRNGVGGSLERDIRKDAGVRARAGVGVDVGGWVGVGDGSTGGVGRGVGEDVGLGKAVGGRVGAGRDVVAGVSVAVGTGRGVGEAVGDGGASALSVAVGSGPGSACPPHAATLKTAIARAAMSTTRIYYLSRGPESYSQYIPPTPSYVNVSSGQPSAWARRGRWNPLEDPNSASGPQWSTTSSYTSGRRRAQWTVQVSTSAYSMS